MIEEFEYKGDWWLPDNPQKRIKGMLKFKPSEGATLDLIGSFKDFKNFNIALDLDIILGETTNGKAITLYKCFEKSSSMSLPGSITSLIFANYVFVGIHFQKAEAIVFKNMSVHYYHLDEWINKPNCTMEFPKDEEEKTVTIRYTLPQPIPIANDKQYKISINFNASIPTPSAKGVAIKQKAVIIIETTQEMAFEYYRTILYQIQNFLCLGITEATYPIFISGTTEASKIELEGKSHYNPIEIFFQLSEVPDINKKISGYEMLFVFSDIADNIEVYLGNWLQKAKLLEPVFDLYFGTFYNRRMYLQHRFLSLTQAIESYHRRILLGKYQSDKEYLEGLYSEFMKCILTVSDENFKTGLKTRMKYLNEFSLRKRLMDLSKKHEEILNLRIRNIEKVITDTISTRNFLTHYDLELEKEAKSGEELYILCEKLKFILEICLLFEIALPIEKIKALVERNESYKYLIRMPD
jgi:hypothetical protein